MKNINSIILLFVLTLTLPFWSSAQREVKPQVPIEKVDDLFKNWDNPNKPGIAVGIVNDGEIAHTTGYGMANLEFDIPITAETRFYIGELSNQFTALAIFLLEDESKLSLQDDIRKYITELPEFEKQVTVGNLIDHTSGIRDLAITKSLLGWKDSDAVSSEQAIQLFSAQQKLNDDPGKKQVKNISSFLLLEKVVAKASGMAYKDYIQEKILDPLQMTNTYFDTGSGVIIKNKATGYYPNGDGYSSSAVKELELYNTNVYSTVGDICLWIQNYYQPKVGNAALIHRFSEITSVDGKPLAEKNRNLYFNQFGFWDYLGTKKLYHVSVGGGYAGKIVHFPDQNISAVVLGNGGAYNGGMATLTGKLYVESYFTKTPGLVKVDGIEMDSKTLESFTGDYWEPSELYSRSIYSQNDTLIYDRGNGYKSPIIPIGKNKFQMITFSNVYVTFENRNNEKVMFVQAEGEGKFEHIAYDKEAPWAKNLVAFVGDYFCQELKKGYKLSVDKDKLILENSRAGNIELSPRLIDIFTGNQRYFSEVKFVRNNNEEVKGFYLSTSLGDKLWFEKNQSRLVARKTD